MHQVSSLWKAIIIVFISSFCVMVTELIAARILAPYIGVSLYTWTSIIGVILAGIALGNYLGGKVADRYPSSLILAAIFFIGGLLTVAVLPATKIVTDGDWFGTLPVIWNFTLKTSLIFFLPAIVLSMVTPMVIKLTLANLEKTGGVVGTIYACSTAGSILGTFMTGFYFIIWFGVNAIVWLIAASLIVTGLITLFLWKTGNRFKFSLKNLIIWTSIIELVAVYFILFSIRDHWQQEYTEESNYHTIRVIPAGKNVKILALDKMIHSYTDPDDPTHIFYEYVNFFAEMVNYITGENKAPSLLHLGGGGYTFPRYMETVYPQSTNDVVEIDPLVTDVAYKELGVPLDTSITTYNEDARLFLIRSDADKKYDFVIGDVFNDHSTPYHLTTFEFNELVKSHLRNDGMYLINIVDDFTYGRYMASFVHTLKQTFNHVYLFSTNQNMDNADIRTFVIVATDRYIDMDDYTLKVVSGREENASGVPYTEDGLDEYLAQRNPILLTDNYAPTDILVAPVFSKMNAGY